MVELNFQELIVRRKLDRTDPTGGFVVGQHKAVVLSNQAIVSFVGQDGMVYQYFVRRSEDDTEWVAHPQILRIGPNFLELRPIPKSMAMDDDMLRAIQQAQKDGKPRTKKPS